MTTTKKYLLFFLLSPLVLGCNRTITTVDDEAGTDATGGVLSMLTTLRTTQYFSDDSVPLEDITEILNAGRSSFSGRNMQSWYFAAIINQDVIKEIAGGMRMGPPPGASGSPPPGAPPPGEDRAMLPPSSSAYPKAGFADAPAAIALAGDPDNIFSTGLACQNMVIAAKLLGYGAKIVAGGADQLNSMENRELLQIPDDLNVVAILLVGKPDSTLDMTADGVTGASTRKSLNEISTIIE